MGDIVTSLKKFATEHDMWIFFAAYVSTILGLVFNGVGMGTSHWIEIEVGSKSTHCGPFGDDSDSDILDHSCGYDIDAVYLIPVGTIVTAIGDVVLYYFRKRLERVNLFRVGGALILVGGLLVIIGDDVWAQDMPTNEYISFGFSFVLSVIGGVLMLLAGIVHLSMSLLKDYENIYSSV